ncbi:DinB family protein [Cumulibacter manganitolerans]|uniref:DinB family protein n=1 Tax=Cumulibacter manganitolerans TaxID=1884992 RepID=UPI001297C095|nr:DinB family protein [Cumulibacter manganitolerans]
MSDIQLNESLVMQLDVHWTGQLRPRLQGLTDDEYFWEPVDGCWNVRRRGTSTAPIAAGSGDWVVEFEMPEPVPAPVTTIAWRLAHIVVGVLGSRVASHFGGPVCEYETWSYAGGADEALRQLDEQYAAWVAGVRTLGEDRLAEPCGPAEGPYADYPMLDLVLHINREVIHHGAEIALLRDLYRARGIG